MIPPSLAGRFIDINAEVTRNKPLCILNRGCGSAEFIDKALDQQLVQRVELHRVHISDHGAYTILPSERSLMEQPLDAIIRENNFSLYFVLLDNTYVPVTPLAESKDYYQLKRLGMQVHNSIYGLEFLNLILTAPTMMYTNVMRINAKGLKRHKNPKSFIPKCHWERNESDMLVTIEGVDMNTVGINKLYINSRYMVYGETEVFMGVEFGFQKDTLYYGTIFTLRGTVEETGEPSKVYEPTPKLKFLQPHIPFTEKVNLSLTFIQ